MGFRVQGPLPGAVRGMDAAPRSPQGRVYGVPGERPLDPESHATRDEVERTHLARDGQSSRGTTRPAHVNFRT